MKSFAFITFFTLFSLSCSEVNKNSRNDVAEKDSLTIETTNGSFQQNNSNHLTPLEKIKKDYQELHDKLSLNKLDSTKVIYENDETSGEVVFYKENDTLKFIRHNYSQYSHFSSEENFYIKDNNLFFAYMEELVWNFDGGTPEKSETKDNILEKRFYFDQNNPIQCLEKKYAIRSRSNKNPQSKNIASTEVNCNVDEIIKSYQTLLKYSDKKGKVSMLDN